MIKAVKRFTEVIKKGFMFLMMWLVSVREWVLSQVEAYKLARESGNMSLKTLIGGAVGLVILGTVVPVVWPLIAGTDTDIQAMTGTDAGTTTIQAFWPILLVVCGLGIAAGIIYFGLRKFGLFGK